MKKYLIRGGKLPTEQMSIERYVNENIMGTNVGNFLYLNSIIRALTTDESVSFESTRYRYNFSEKEINRFNQECDGFIIPLADAFRESFIKEMKGLTALVKKLKIPCYIIGVGLQAGSEKKLAEKNFGFENEAREFIQAVLEKSNSVGLRGEMTGHFLEYLGFQEGRDFSVIGCPSMYTFGTNIQIQMRGGVL